MGYIRILLKKWVYTFYKGSKYLAFILMKIHVLTICYKDILHYFYFLKYSIVYTHGFTNLFRLHAYYIKKLVVGTRMLGFFNLFLYLLLLRKSKITPLKY